MDVEAFKALPMYTVVIRTQPSELHGLLAGDLGTIMPTLEGTQEHALARRVHWHRADTFTTPVANIVEVYKGNDR